MYGLVGNAAWVVDVGGEVEGGGWEVVVDMLRAA